ncbi:Flp family type IVb pilin [Cytobacillus sp. FJAT-54145]|uniref:Flp family type IVb pilin n=1 Tax=Cytobacillus spartinae TaxID=3299023 RepID=A0ABW6K9Q9_9BACI
MVKQTLKRLAKEEKGQGFSEYGLILGLIAVVGIAALLVLGPKIAAKFSQVAANL